MRKLGPMHGPADDFRIPLLLRSYQRYWGNSLCEDAQRLWQAPFAVLAHGTEDPPILFYGNACALELWEMSWEAFTGMPSFRTAEPDERGARARVLEQVGRQGFSEGYSGVRVSHTGRRFVIRDARVWNIVAEDGGYAGQAATFSQWNYLE